MAAAKTVGVVICCHGEMAAGLRSAAEMIVGPQPHLETVGVRPADGRGDVEAALQEAAAKVDAGAGVLVLTDIAGGTPCVEAARRRGASREIVAGVNLPAVIEVLVGRTAATDLQSLAAAAARAGRRHLLTGRELFEPGNGDPLE